MNNFSIASKTINDIAVFMPKGYMDDLGVESLEHEWERFLDSGLRKLIINFSNIQYINSIGASILTGIVQKTSEHKGYLCFTNMKKVHLDVFKILGLTKHVKVFREEKEALNFLKNVS